VDDLRRDAWHGGQLLAFSGLDGATDYEHGLVARTAFDMPAIDVKLPAPGRIRFPPVRGAIQIAGDWFRLGETVTGVYVDAHHLLIVGACEVVDAAPELAVARKGDRTLVGWVPRFDATNLDVDLEATLRARQKWLSERHAPAGASAPTRRTFAKCLSQLKTQIYTPEGRIRHRWTTPDRWPHRMMWLWDSAFHAIGLRHVDPAMAREALLAVLDMQGQDGFIAHMMSPAHTSEITQPPILALGVKLVNDVAPDAAWIAEVYPKLCAYVRWDMRHRDRDGAGLLEWAIEGDPFCRSGESGMDNSPRFDAATAMDATDFNAFLASECEVLAELAASLGRDREAAEWRGEHTRLCQLIRSRLWSDDLKFFVDFDVEKNEPSPVIASSGFLPLVCGAATPEQAAHLVAALRAPEMFGTTFPVPSIAVKDRGHYVKDMWRGPVWINLNWLIARGLERYGYHPEAAALRDRTQQEIETYCDKYGTLFEFYDDRGECDPPQLLRKGQCAPERSPYHQAFHDYGWTATLYVDLVHSTR
jgi:hypothetical protein